MRRIQHHYDQKNLWVLLRRPCTILVGIGFVSFLCMVTEVMGQASPSPSKISAEQSGGIDSANTVFPLSSELEKSLVDLVERLADPPLFPQVIVGFIGLLGAIVGAFITYHGLKKNLQAQKEGSDKSLTEQRKLAEESLREQRRLLVEEFKHQRQLVADQEALKRVNLRLNEFYLPLLALAMSGRSLWEEFCKIHNRKPDNILKHIDDTEFTDKENQAYFADHHMRVMGETFKPLNEQYEKLVLAKAGLAAKSKEPDGLPPHLIKLVSHVSELRSQMRRWDKFKDDQGKYNRERIPLDTNWKENFQAVFPFPEDLDRYVKRESLELIKEKEELESRLSALPVSRRHFRV